MGHPLVTVLVPAYNEELCIKKTLQSLLVQSYSNLEIIVINDGSTDRTKEKVNEFLREHEKEINKKRRKSNWEFIFIDQKNTGKAGAMNKGLSKSQGEFITSIDADSYLSRSSIESILKYFDKDNVGAVAGNIKGISHNKFIGYLQTVEYELGVNIFRRAQATLGNVMVTPGAFSCYRRKALKKFEDGTVTEDFDTSIRILERGYKIVTASDAYAFTQVPLSYSDLIKQRVRWQQGGLEVFAKHLFHSKRFLVKLEWVFTFFYTFYGTFTKVLSFLIIPFIVIDKELILPALAIFYGYTIIINTILFSLVYSKIRDIKVFLLIPIYSLYFYTVILYSTFVGQLVAMQNKKKWEKLKRYHM
tara:strand:+ start:426 stop:1505 length:1080 start_codon:yes stop_codon:yes gene_type:complete